MALAALKLSSNPHFFQRELLKGVPGGQGARAPCPSEAVRLDTDTARLATTVR